METTYWANARLDLQRHRVFEVGEFFFLVLTVLTSSKVLEETSSCFTRFATFLDVNRQGFEKGDV